MKTCRVGHLAELQALVGQELAVSDWLTIDQARIDQFAQATGDHQWIHVDPVRAAAGPFGRTIAHGYLTLSLLPMLIESVVEIGDAAMGINYGLNKVRFTAPVPVGSKVRARVALAGYEVLDGGAQIEMAVQVELEGSDRPACVAQVIGRRYTAG